MIFSYISRNPQQTKKLAARFAKHVRPGDIIGLSGMLGSGKTVFVKGMVKALGIKGRVISPTFIISKIYTGKIKRKKTLIVHADAYRLDSLADLESTGLTDFLGQKNTIVIIEWIEKIRRFIPSKKIITISIVYDRRKKDTRHIKINSSRKVI